MLKLSPSVTLLSCTLILGAAGMVGGGAATLGSKVLRTQRLQIVDAKGVLHGEFYAEEEHVILNLMDHGGTGIVMSVIDDSSFITLDQRKGSKIQIATTPENGQISMDGTGGKHGFIVNRTAKGTAGAIFGPDGKLIWSEGAGQK